MPSQFELFTFVIFICAVIHTFLTPSFYSLYHQYDRMALRNTKKSNHYRSLSEIFYLLSEVELVFGFWILPLALGLFFISDLDFLVSYLQTRDYTYALYMTVVVAFVSTKPIVHISEKILEAFSKLGGNHPRSWWWTILTLGPVFDIFLKEPGAMTISSILLAKTVFPFIKNTRFQYATLALLFINISLGGLFLPQFSRSLFLIARQENWEIAYTFFRFSWKAFLIIVLNNGFYYVFFRKYLPTETKPIQEILEKEKKGEPPFWIILIHLVFLGLIVVSSEYPPIFLGMFFLFLGVHRATFSYQGKEQGPLFLKPAILVGFFFASLLIHGEFQKWWAVQLLENVDFKMGYVTSIFLSSLIDNAVVLYFLDQFKPISEEVLYAFVTGSLSSGALTLMANGPNLIGYSNLREFFNGKVSLIALFFAALPLTILASLIFWIFI